MGRFCADLADFGWNGQVSRRFGRLRLEWADFDRFRPISTDFGRFRPISSERTRADAGADTRTKTHTEIDKIDTKPRIPAARAAPRIPRAAGWKP
jgi:hypothetical protein